MDVLTGGVAPGVVAFVTRTGLLRTGLLRAPGGDRVAWPFAVAMGCVAGWVAMTVQRGAGAGLPAALAKAVGQLLAPSEASQWLPWWSLGSAAAAALVHRRGVLGLSAKAVLALLAAAMPLRILWGSSYLVSRWSTAEAMLRLAMMAGGLLAILLIAMSPAADPTTATQPRDRLRALLLAGVSLALAVLLATSGSLWYGRLAGALVAAIVGATLGAVGTRAVADLGEGVAAAAPTIALIASGLLLCGLFFAEVATPHAASLGLALAAAASAPRRKGWKTAALRVLLAVGLSGYAAAASGLAFLDAVKVQPSNPYENWRPAAP